MAPVPRFRRAGPADAAAIRTLTRAAYGPWVPLIGREPLPMATDFDQAVASDLIDLLEQDAEFLALIQMKVRVGHLWLDNVAVHPDHQGQGLGHRLIAHAEAVARDLGLPELRLLTNAAFAANLRFYEGLGFHETAREDFRGGVTVHYAKLL